MAVKKWIKDLIVVVVCGAVSFGFLYLNNSPFLKESSFFKDSPFLKDNSDFKDNSIFKNTPFSKDTPVLKDIPILKDSPILKDKSDLCVQLNDIFADYDKAGSRNDVLLKVKAYLMGAESSSKKLACLGFLYKREKSTISNDAYLKGAIAEVTARGLSHYSFEPKEPDMYVHLWVSEKKTRDLLPQLSFIYLSDIVSQPNEEISKKIRHGFEHSDAPLEEKLSYFREWQEFHEEKGEAVKAFNYYWRANAYYTSFPSIHFDPDDDDGFFKNDKVLEISEPLDDWFAQPTAENAKKLENLYEQGYYGAGNFYAFTLIKGNADGSGKDLKKAIDIFEKNYNDYQDLFGISWLINAYLYGEGREIDLDKAGALIGVVNTTLERNTMFLLNEMKSLNELMLDYYVKTNQDELLNREIERYGIFQMSLIKKINKQATSFYPVGNRYMDVNMDDVLYVDLNSRR